ncbi:substrate-binding periplasmic protein [Colwelliaceae bacterium 6441]
MTKLLLFYSLLLVSSCFFCPQVDAQEVHVGFEPFPPLINENGGGFAIEMLQALTDKSDLTFNFTLMTYARAKKELKERRLDLIGLTPKGNESEEFYQYANELDWSFDAYVDFFSKEKFDFELNTLAERSIGTLIGNADFFAQLSHIPRENFVEVSSLKQLVKMLDKGRINLALFERISMITTLKKHKIQNIYHKHLFSIPASLAVANTKSGYQLKEKLDKILKGKINDEFNMKLANFNKVADFGLVK